MWKVLIFASLLGFGSLMVEVLLSGMGLVTVSGFIFSAVLEIGSRAWVSLTEAKPREKTAGRTAAGRGSVEFQLGVARESYPSVV